MRAKTHLCLRRKVLITPVTLERPHEHMIQFAMLSQLARRQEFSTAVGALEAAVGAAMKLQSVRKQAILAAHVANRHAFKAHVPVQKSSVISDTPM